MVVCLEGKTGAEGGAVFLEGEAAAAAAYDFPGCTNTTTVREKWVKTK